MSGHVLWIVARHRKDVYDLLVRHLRDSRTDSIMFDRRRAERRQQAIPVEVERRRGRDRRRRQDPALALRGWMAIRTGSARAVARDPALGRR